MAGDRLMSISQDERERAVMRSRRMAETDRQSDLATEWDNGMREGMQRGMQEGIQRGMQEGIQRGVQEGMQKGEKSKAFSIARLMADAGELDDKIMQYTGLSRDEIHKLKN